MKTLSKSRFVSGVQCEKKLWYSYYRKDIQLPTDEQTQAILHHHIISPPSHSVCVQT